MVSLNEIGHGQASNDRANIGNRTECKLHYQPALCQIQMQELEREPL